MKREVKSSLAAEALSLVDGLDTAYCIRSLFTEIIHSECDVSKTALQDFVDNKFFVQSAYSLTLVSEKRLRVDLAAIQQTVERREATLKWTSSQEQIADCLTKAGVPVTSFWTLSSVGSYICIQVNRNITFYRQWTIFIKTIVHYLHSVQRETMEDLFY